ncbi:MAG: hypothetical protein ACE5HI_19805 [bacterium]
MNPGTLNSPWFTIQYVAETIAVGDTILIRDGPYYEHESTMRDGSETNGYIIQLFRKTLFF